MYHTVYAVLAAVKFMPYRVCATAIFYPFPISQLKNLSDDVVSLIMFCLADTMPKSVSSTFRIYVFCKCIDYLTFLIYLYNALLLWVK